MSDTKTKSSKSSRTKSKSNKDASSKRTSKRKKTSGRSKRSAPQEPEVLTPLAPLKLPSKSPSPKAGASLSGPISSLSSLRKTAPIAELLSERVNIRGSGVFDDFNLPREQFPDPDNDSGTHFENSFASDAEEVPSLQDHQSPFFAPCDRSPSPPANRSQIKGLMDIPTPYAEPKKSPHESEKIYRPKSTAAMNPFKQQMHQLLDSIMQEFPSSEDEISETESMTQHVPIPNHQHTLQLLQQLEEVRSLISSSQSRPLVPSQRDLIHQLGEKLIKFSSSN